jgi:hypothetical protein
VAEKKYCGVSWTRPTNNPRWQIVFTAWIHNFRASSKLRCSGTTDTRRLEVLRINPGYWTGYETKAVEVPSSEERFRKSDVGIDRRKMVIRNYLDNDG